MRKIIFTAVIFFILCKSEAATQEKHIEINANSKSRSVCHIEFPATQGLSVDAKLAPAQAYHSRVNNERYAACPYDVNIRYGDQVMRLDFGSSFDLESVKRYRHSFPVDSGFFIYDGQEWSGQPSTMQNSENEILVTDGGNSVTVTGLLRRNDPNSKVRDYCYAITIVYDSGYATGGVCSTKKEQLKSWQQLFSNDQIRYKP
jgi:hypothetical protein